MEVHGNRLQKRHLQKFILSLLSKSYHLKIHVINSRYHRKTPLKSSQVMEWQRIHVVTAGNYYSNSNCQHRTRISISFKVSAVRGEEGRNTRREDGLHSTADLTAGGAYEPNYT